MISRTMPNKAAIDFGNSNTVAAVWNERTRCPEVLTLPEYSSPGSFLIPSTISYEPDGRFYIGEQIPLRSSAEGKIFRWMKRYISLRSPYALRVGECRIDAYRAAKDYLGTVIRTAFPESENQPDEIYLSVPVESFEHYSEWLISGMTQWGNTRIRLIDEASAAAAGYGLNLHPGNSLLVVDIGGSTMQAVCVSVMEEGIQKGRCCRVLGKAGLNSGGMAMDRWLYEYALKRLGLSENDPFLRSCSGELLRYCEQFKMSLSSAEQAAFDFFQNRYFLMTRTELEDLFRDCGLFASLDTVIEEALRTAADHGLRRDELTAVLPVGGSCLIPSVRTHLERLFPQEKVLRGEPLGAVARGAAVIAGGMHIYDFIQHNYAIRYTDPRTGSYAFRTIIPKGTKYPAPRLTSPMKLKAVFPGQDKFGIAIYELREEDERPSDANEIFFDADGSAHVMPLTEEESRSETLFWMNERNPLFLSTDQPGEPGIPRFEMIFGIDENKMLCISAVDLFSGKTVLQNHPAVRLV